MSNKVPNRKLVRAELSKLLESACPSAQAVYDYQKSDLEGESPIIRVISIQTNPEAFTHMVMNVKLTFSVQIIVLYDDPNVPAYTEEMAEDYFDDVWTEVINFLASNMASGEYIRDVRPTGSSSVEKFILGGSTYIAEMIPVEVQLK